MQPYAILPTVWIIEVILLAIINPVIVQRLKSRYHRHQQVWKYHVELHLIGHERLLKLFESTVVSINPSLPYNDKVGFVIQFWNKLRMANPWNAAYFFCAMFPVKILVKLNLKYMLIDLKLLQDDIET